MSVKSFGLSSSIRSRGTLVLLVVKAAVDLFLGGDVHPTFEHNFCTRHPPISTCLPLALRLLFTPPARVCASLATVFKFYEVLYVVQSLTATSVC